MDQAWVPACEMFQQAVGWGATYLWAAELLPMSIRNYKSQTKEGKDENTIKVNCLGRRFLMSLLTVLLFLEKEGGNMFLEMQ